MPLPCLPGSNIIPADSHEKHTLGLRSHPSLDTRPPSACTGTVIFSAAKSAHHHPKKNQKASDFFPPAACSSAVRPHRSSARMQCRAALAAPPSISTEPASDPNPSISPRRASHGDEANPHFGNHLLGLQRLWHPPHSPMHSSPGVFRSGGSFSLCKRERGVGTEFALCGIGGEGEYRDSVTAQEGTGGAQL